MPQVLELSELVQDDRVPEVDVGRGRVESQLAAQRDSGGRRPGELLRELGLDQQFVTATPDRGQRLLHVR